VSTGTRPDRRRAERTAARTSQSRGKQGRADGPATARKAASSPRPARGRRGAGFLNTLIIALLVVLVIMLVAVFLVAGRYIL
jgi:hypothetical protein